MDRSKLNLVAANPAELKELLSAINITVPLETEGRKKEHRERYMMARLLATLSGSGSLKFPVLLDHRERPDFALQIADRRVGVECVEAVPEQWAEIQTFREENFPDAWISPPMFRPGDKALSRKRQTEIAKGERLGPPWVGQMAQKQWIAAIESFVAQKTKKLRAGNYNEFDENWLLIQDEWPVPLYGRKEREEAASSCKQKLGELLMSPAFANIFITNSKWLIHIAPNRVETMSIYDLWD